MRCIDGRAFIIIIMCEWNLKVVLAFKECNLIFQIEYHVCYHVGISDLLEVKKYIYDNIHN